MVDVSPEVYEIMSSFVYLVGRLNAECGGGIGQRPRSQTDDLCLGF